jgi:hypothetical protein
VRVCGRCKPAVAWLAGRGAWFRAAAVVLTPSLCIRYVAGALSGTLGFVMSGLQQGLSFSAVVHQVPYASLGRALEGL